MELVSEFKRIGVEHFTRWLGEHDMTFGKDPFAIAAIDHLIGFEDFSFVIKFCITACRDRFIVRVIDDFVRVDRQSILLVLSCSGSLSMKLRTGKRQNPRNHQGEAKNPSRHDGEALGRWRNQNEHKPLKSFNHLQDTAK